MIEVRGNLWTFPADVRVITTNGSIKNDAIAVMGRGCAAEAAKQWPDLPIELGTLLREGGNYCYHLKSIAMPTEREGILKYWELWSMPVKRQWWERADMELIRQSAIDLAAQTANKWVVLPRPGCGNGHLKWEDVKPILEPILDDRFHVITF